MSREDAVGLNDLFHKCVKARTFIAEDFEGEVNFSLEKIRQYITYTMAYYLDEPFLKGMNEYFRLGSEEGHIPKTSYKSASYNIVNNDEIVSSHNRPISQLLDTRLEGGRLSIRDGVRLAQEASISDLSMTVDSLRVRDDSLRSVYWCLELEAKDVDDLDQYRTDLQRARLKGFTRLALRLTDPSLNEMKKYENALHELRGKMGFEVTAFTIPDLLTLAEQSKVDVKEVITRLVTAGLNSVSGSSDELLLVKSARSHKQGLREIQDWLQVGRWLYRFGARLSASMVLSPEHTWEDRVVHLERLRALQDEDPVLRHFAVIARGEYSSPYRAEDRLRATLLGRIFLDNVRYMQEVSLDQNGVGSIVGLCFGSNEVRINVSLEDLDKVDTHAAIIRQLSGLGIDIEGPYSRLQDAPSVH